MDMKRFAASRPVHAGALALLTAGCWWVWMAWDYSYYLDPAGDLAGPYRPWQVAGCVLSLIVLAVAAAWRLPGWLVIAVMPLAFTAAWSATASTFDSNGLWVIGAIGVGVGMLAGTTVVTVGTAGLRRVARSLTAVGSDQPAADSGSSAGR